MQNPKISFTDNRSKLKISFKKGFVAKIFQSSSNLDNKVYIFLNFEISFNVAFLKINKHHNKSHLRWLVIGSEPGGNIVGVFTHAITINPSVTILITSACSCVFDTFNYWLFLSASYGAHRKLVTNLEMLIQKCCYKTSCDFRISCELR